MQSDRPIEQSAIPEKSRRQFLQKGAQAATALLGTSVIGACGGGGDGGSGAASTSSLAALLPASANPAGPISPESSAAPPAAAMPALAKSPVIHSFSPSLEKRGKVIVISGAEFDSSASVCFGEVVATRFSVDSPNQISVFVPDSAKDAEIIVRTAGGEARSSRKFEVALVPESARDYRLAWHDEFEGSALDPAKWAAVTGVRANAVQTPEAATVADSVLKISTYTDPSAGTHHTGFLRTARLYEFRFGYIEARVRFASKPGQWSAFWLMSNANKAATPPDPAAGVEVDIIEHREFSENDAGKINNQFSSAVHWNGYETGKTISRNTGQQQLPAGQSFSEWHTVGLLWTPEGYEFYLDGAATPYATIKEGVSLSNQYIKLTCEIKDHGWAGNIPSSGYGPLGAGTNATMEVDWVRVWQAA
ncbi:family 16 glycosylhydrolase [Variovorax guangxiensis]|uniref:Beta-glucanase (GH16 family) n=1 Tax=Variovorax guangxiensis TaxID=1775474 RepID=A0A840FR10_9BURK|nr:family 16 glycosylhydrolase [Variovorax guangxiensis]MBB4221760.1 beta-glucanase (GH16 family) [Variovorax guangxiensis]